MGKTKTIQVGAEAAKKESKSKKASIKGVGLKGGERVVTVEAGPVIKEDIKVLSGKDTKKKTRKERVRSKKYQEAKTKIDKSKLYNLEEAVKLVKETSYSKFDGAVELHLVVKKEGLSANVTLPHASGKTKKIEVADENTIKKLGEGKIDFDVLLATPEMMPKLVPFAKLLGPRGLMPNPKNGTLLKKAEDARNFSANSVSIKTEKKAPLIHSVVGRVSQKETELIENTNAMLEAINRRQIVKAYMKPTMGPVIKIQVI